MCEDAHLCNESICIYAQELTQARTASAIGRLRLRDVREREEARERERVTELEQQRERERLLQKQQERVKEEWAERRRKEREREDETERERLEVQQKEERKRNLEEQTAGKEKATGQEGSSRVLSSSLSSLSLPSPCPSPDDISLPLVRVDPFSVRTAGINPQPSALSHQLSNSQTLFDY